MTYRWIRLVKTSSKIYRLMGLTLIFIMHQLDKDRIFHAQKVVNRPGGTFTFFSATAGATGLNLVSNESTRWKIIKAQ